MTDDIVGDYYLNAYYKLADADEDGCEYDNTTTATKMWSANTKPFAGHFDGNGKTLNVNLYGESFAAPFLTTNGAIIKNLSVGGDISAQTVGGGIVGYAVGTLTMENCISDAYIWDASAYAGGFIGWCGNLTLNMKNCLFLGRLTIRKEGKVHPIACKDSMAVVVGDLTGAYYKGKGYSSSQLVDFFLSILQI